MTKNFMIALAMIFGLQSVALASSRVDFVDKKSQQIRLENKAQLLGQLVLAEETLRELKANLAESVDGNFTYKAAVAVRSGALIAVGVSALAFIGFYLHSKFPLNPAVTMINTGGQMVTGVGALVNVGNALIAQGVVTLTGEEIDALETQIQNTEIGIQVLKTQLTQK